MRSVLIFTCALTIAAGPGGAAQHTRGRPETAHEYAHRLVSKRSLALAGASAAVGQVRNHPHEWGTGIGGYARRVGSALGEHVVKETIQFGVATLHHEDLHYYRSNLHGTLPRLGYAVKSTFIVPRTDRAGKTVAAGRISGAFGAGIVSRAWQPASTAGIGAGIASGGIILGADVGANVAREFWPRKKARPPRRHSARRTAHSS
ncbi:MAG TPA: hypothetical protein VLW65_10335 [Bryobacteraceae bacterium]|nr:hypothetical protein [Bryobacteraceae bacterium]